MNAIATRDAAGRGGGRCHDIMYRKLKSTDFLSSYSRNSKGTCEWHSVYTENLVAQILHILVAILAPSETFPLLSFGAMV